MSLENSMVFMALQSFMPPRMISGGDMQMVATQGQMPQVSIRSGHPSPIRALVKGSGELLPIVKK